MICPQAMIDLISRTPSLISVVLPEEAVKEIRKAAAALSLRIPRPRQERLSGIHNPWGMTAALTDTWAFLDFCENSTLLDAVTSIIGPDIILWDSELYLRAADYVAFVNAGREGRYWPMTTPEGAVVLVSFTRPADIRIVDVCRISVASLQKLPLHEAIYVIRYMSALRHFCRDLKLPANRLAMEEWPLVNYTTRPLWLVRGEDKAGNDFVTGFSVNTARWANL